MAVVAALLNGSVAREVREASPATSAPAGADGSIRLLAVVDLAGGGAARVPFVVVRTATGAWLVREIGLAGLVGEGGPGSGAPNRPATASVARRLVGSARARPLSRVRPA